METATKIQSENIISCGKLLFDAVACLNANVFLIVSSFKKRYPRSYVYFQAGEPFVRFASRDRELSSRVAHLYLVKIIEKFKVEAKKKEENLHIGQAEFIARWP